MAAASRSPVADTLDAAARAVDPAAAEALAPLLAALVKRGEWG